MKKHDLQSKNLPSGPGVYFFKNGAEILYVGKATSLKTRVESYFRQDMMEARGALIVKMLKEATTVEWEETDSALEALLLEAHRIKKYQPPYNSKEKDNKSFNYVVITKEDFPRVLVVRGRELFYLEEERRKNLTPEKTRSSSNVSILRHTPIKKMFGPFPHGATLKEALKIIRKIFAFRDTCTPWTEVKDKHNIRPCFNQQIGLCPGVCTGEISKREYQNIIRNITLFFEGKKNTLIKKLEREMNAHAKKEEFEKAEEVKRTMFALTHIKDISLIKGESFGGPHRDRSDYRIESYDIAHIAGTHVVGVMTVVENGQAKRSDYRKFNIKRDPGVDDTGALQEVLDRRLNHPEWPWPDMIVVDGGRAQKNTAEAVLKERGFSTLVVAVTKNTRHKPEKLLGDAQRIKEYEKEVLLSNAEAHRFAITFHRKKRDHIK